jgi:hypothetical protein
MPKTHPRLTLSPEEEFFLRQWMFDEVHFEEGQGPAKRLQVAQGVRPAELSLLIAAVLPDPAEQQAAVCGATRSACRPGRGRFNRFRIAWERLRLCWLHANLTSANKLGEQRRHGSCDRCLAVIQSVKSGRMLGRLARID